MEYKGKLMTLCLLTAVFCASSFVDDAVRQAFGASMVDTGLFGGCITLAAWVRREFV